MATVSDSYFSTRPASAGTDVSTLHESVLATDPQLALKVMRGGNSTQDHSGFTELAANAPASAPAAKPEHHTTAPAARVCAPTKDYVNAITFEARNIYDIASMGDVSAMLHNTKCAASFVDKANDALAITHDHYNEILSKAEVAQLTTDESGQYAGVGLELGEREVENSSGANGAVRPRSIATKDSAQHQVVIKHVFPHSPAEAAGLKWGDAIVNIGTTDTRGMSIDDLAAHLDAGRVGTTVNVTIMRDGKLIQRTLTRAQVHNPSVEDPRELGNGITYVPLRDFENNNTADQLKAALLKFPQTKAFVIDVRGNRGGLMEEGIQAAELFIDHGKIMTLREREDSDPRHPIYSNIEFGVAGKNAYTTTNGKVHLDPREPDVVGNRPVVVLTNGGSASSAEIFTGAMHDTANATTIGEKTYGKGIAQLVNFSGPGGTGMKVTEAHYQTPSGAWPGDAGDHRIGLTPDIAVTNPPNVEPGSAADRQLNTAMDFLKRRLSPTHSL